MSHPHIVLTIDTDWASSILLRDTLNLLEKFDVSSTFFLTNKLNNHVTGLLREHHEIGLHPKFDVQENSPQKDHLVHLRTTYPDAISARSHSLQFSTRIAGLLRDFDIQFTSNVYVDKNHEVQPFGIQYDLIEFPIYEMDYFLLTSASDQINPEKILDDINLQPSRITVFCFHPIHIYLNTPTLRYYRQRKELTHTEEDVLEERFSGSGIRDVFIGLLERISRARVNTSTLGKLGKQMTS